MAQLTADTSVMDAWAEYAEQGLEVFPLKSGGKNPGTDFGIKWQQDWIKAGRRTWPDLANIYETGTYGLWLATGQISKRVVLDLDRPEAETYWRKQLGEVIFNKALKVKTRKGHHLHFRIRADDDRPWDSHSEESQIGYDFRADNTGVVMPPSVHATGVVYEWVGGELMDAPDSLRKENQPERVAARASGRPNATASTLADLLALEPDDPGRGNNWLARVAGHLAKAERRYYDRYLGLLRNVNWASDDPIEEGDFMKTVESIWASESGKTQTHSQDNGWLIGDGSRLFTLQSIGTGDEKKLIHGEWADFDIRVKSITRATDGTMVYTVDLVTGDHMYESIPLDPAIFSTDSKLTQWLAIRGATILPPPYDEYGSHSNRARLAKYLKHQEASSSNAVRHLGWNTQLKQFITHEGVIADGAISPHDGSVPDPVLASWSPYRYGVVPQAEALNVLREVLTFQDETVTSVFGSWWVMTQLKGRFQASQFPFMSIEAPSESGKSTGFFAMMVGMAGNTNGHGKYTAPAFRDALAGHRNGVTWLDDVTEITDLQDMIRQLTAEGHTSKKGTDRRETETIQLLCPLVVSGEGLGSVMSEKAMRDRAISLEVTSPKGRRSLKDPSRPQWDDVQELLAQYGGGPENMSAVAGTLVSLIHSKADMLSEIKELRTGAGRHGDKMSIIRMGARILAALTDDPQHIERVDYWVSTQQDEGSVNYAISEIIPWFLRSNMVPTSANGHQAAYYDGKTDSVWVSPQKLADAWRGRSGLTSRERQLGTEDAIRSELKANAVDLTGKPKWTDRTNNQKSRYSALTGNLSTIVMDKVGATMDTPED